MCDAKLCYMVVPAAAVVTRGCTQPQVTANPNITVGLADVPSRCRRARAVLLGPLTLHDIDAASFLHQRRGEARGIHTHRCRATLPPPLQPPRACLVVCAFCCRC